ncbi:preprotein translocase subunit SecG [bacterium]|nr:preprotein translocase subunit SecG [bacterium]
MENIITGIQIVCAVLLVAAILIQPSKGGSFMAASTQNAHMSNAPTSFLFKLSMGLIAVIMVSSLALSRWAIQSSTSSITDSDIPAVPVPTE